MSTRSHIFIPDEIYFLTFTILGWQKVFTDDRYCAPVYKWFDYLKHSCSNEIHGYVIMPNHLHLLLYISDKSPKLPVLIMNGKRFIAYELVKLLIKDNNSSLLNYFSIKVRTRDKAKHKVFNDRFDSQVIQTQKFFLQKLNYIHNNPCQENWCLTENPEDYRYSSAANYILDKGYYEIDLFDF